MAEDLNTIKDLLAARVSIMGYELDRMDEQMKTLDQETQHIQESFATMVAERLEAASSRQRRHKELTSQLHEAIQDEGHQAMQRDLKLEQELQ